MGFFEDGTAIAGTPKLSITLTGPDGAERPIHALNNVRTSAGIYLYTQDFDATTATTAAGTEVVLEPVKGDPLRLGRKLKARVVSTAHVSGTPIGPDQLVLSLTDSCTAGVTLSDLAVGDQVTIYAATEDPAWNDVVWGSGGGNMLARNGQLTSDATAEVAPRTVLGIREDGSVRILECDGRQAALSTGISLIEAAQLLLAEGCVTVINLDGGGSSILAAAYPGKATTVLSSPSEGSPRACATYLLFVTEGDGSGIRDRRILLAEDNETNAMIAQEVLEEMGGTVEIAENGRIALEKFRDHQQGYYDYILMDVQMPEMDGRTAAREIRKLSRPDAKTIPIFALSADAFVEDERLSLESGMNGHFAKPVDFAALERSVGAFLKMRGGK